MRWAAPPFAPLSNDLLVSRFKNPQPDVTDSAGAHWTWRGTPGIKSPEAGKYYKKGMRIDYSLVSTELLPRLISSEIVGKDFQRSRFYGSDHSPIVLKLNASASGTKVASLEAAPDCAETATN